MSLNDPLADMIVRIKNGQAAGKSQVAMPSSRLKSSVCQVLLDAGYIAGFSLQDLSKKVQLTVDLKYYGGAPVISSFHRTSKPGRRVYKKSNALPRVLGGFGIAIVSTSKGVMTDHQARELGYGGEVLCTVS